MPLISVYRKFLLNTFRLRYKADAIYSIPVNHEDWRFHYASMSLISETWQAWCRFCCEVIQESCRGTQLRNGTLVPRRTADNSRERIAYEILEYARSQTPRPAKRFTYLSQEPTWGDVNLLLRALPRLGVSNSPQLITAFGISTQAPAHLQIVRNACFHMNRETIKKVRSIQPFYVGTVNHHPCELIWCLESNSRSDAVYFWLDEMETIAALAT
jgi:hypothetical protein